MKTKIHPGVAALILIAVVGALFGIMWYQSEAPKLNRLPRPLGFGPPARRPKPPAKTAASPPKPETSHKSAEAPAAASGAASKP